MGAGHVTASAEVPEPLRVLVYSDDASTRQKVALALGPRPTPALPPIVYVECATEWAVLDTLRHQDIALAVLDGEAVPAGGLGVCRTVKEEVFGAPPVMVLLGRPQDEWLASWSRADGVAHHPLEPAATAEAVLALLLPSAAGAAVATTS